MVNVLTKDQVEEIFSTNLQAITNMFNPLVLNALLGRTNLNKPAAFSCMFV